MNDKFFGIFISILYLLEFYFLTVAEEESKTLGSHLLASHFLQEEITPKCDPQSEAGLPQGYDVYRDANFSEVIKCVPLLHRLMHRVTELREEWPHHPTLTQVRCYTQVNTVNKGTSLLLMDRVREEWLVFVH